MKQTQLGYLSGTEPPCYAFSSSLEQSFCYRYLREADGWTYSALEGGGMKACAAILPACQQQVGRKAMVTPN